MAITFKSGIHSARDIESDANISGNIVKAKNNAEITNDAFIGNNTETETLTFKNYEYTCLNNTKTKQLNQILDDIVARISSITTNTIQTINNDITNLQNQVGKVTTTGSTTTRTGLEKRVYDTEQSVSTISTTVNTLSTTVGDASSGLVKKVGDLENKMNTMGFKGGYIIIGRLHNGTEADKKDVIGYIAKLGTLVYGYIKDGGTLGNYLAVDSINIYKKDSNATDGDFPGLSLAGAEVPGPTSCAINWLGNNGSKRFSVRGFSFGRNSDGSLKISFQSGTGSDFKDSDIANNTHWAYFAYDNSGNFEPSKNAPARKELEKTITTSNYIINSTTQQGGTTIYSITINDVSQWKPFPLQIIEISEETAGSYTLPTPYEVSYAQKSVTMSLNTTKIPKDSEITVKYKYIAYD